MRKRRLTLAASICTAAMLFPGSPANAGPPPTGTSPSAVEAGSAKANQHSQKAANSVAAMEKQVNTDAFIAKKDKPDSQLKGTSAKAEAQNSADDLGRSVKEKAKSMSDNSKSPRHVDKVDVKITGITAKKKSNGNLLVTAQVRILRHIVEDNTDWVEVVPHEIEVNARGCILNLTVKDLDYYDKHPGNSLPEEPKGNSSSQAQIKKVALDKNGTKTIQMGVAPSNKIAPASLTQQQKQKAVDYARKYAEKPNWWWYYIYPQDCTNFVSQAMYNGGWTQVFHPWVDYKQDDAWWYGGLPRNTWTWSGAENFYRMATGPNGLHRTTLVNDPYQLEPGDILQYKAKGESNMTHTMIVTKTGADGMPYLSYHTNNTLDKPFSEMANKEVTWFAHRT